MAITWIDMPGSELASRDDAIDFEVTGGNDSAPAPAIWKKVYEVDFTALPAQPSCPPGSYVVDGKTWWVKGQHVVGGHSASAELSPGNGLRINSDFHMCYPHSIYGGVNPYLRWFMPLAQLAGFNEAAPLVLMARMKNALANNCVAFAGFIDSPDDTTGPTTGAKADHITQAGLANNAAGYAGSSVSFGRRADSGNTASPGGASMYAVMDPPNAATPNAFVTIYRASRSAALCAASRWTGSFPSPDAIEIPDNLSGHQSYAFRHGAAAPANLGITFVAQDQSALVDQPYDLMQMCIWQPGSP